MVIRLTASIYTRLEHHRRWVALAIYGGVAIVAYILAFVLRFELTWRPEYSPVFLRTMPLLVLTRLVCAHAFGLLMGRWRFVSTRDVHRLAAATVTGSVIFFALTRIVPLPLLVPRSVILVEWVLTTYLTAGLWIGYRSIFERVRYRRAGINGRARRVLIVGAGEAGNQLAREMRRIPTGYYPVGFIDDDPAKWGTSLQGVAVLGPTSELAPIASREGVQELIIALPSATPADLRRVVERCEATELPFKVLPGIASVLAGEARVDQLREVRIEDLLGREPIRLELPELAEDLRGEVALITGAAGSIGSELARQVALHEPMELILLDQAETDLFYLELELRERHPGLKLTPVIADVVDEGGVERVFRTHAPSRIYHAAAYKHVPMMEANPHEAVRNNVIGTWQVAEAAGRHRAEKFVLVSTDKAVRPTSVMGATKRLAEAVILDLQERFPETRYCAVRFGNVLGSNGSVIPVFKRQLASGKPLTVTHPEATRYFMTIPEAVQLILQASLLPEMRGRIAMLEMGEPVRIVDLARNLLRMSGAANGNGKGLVFTGLRPGEKLHEELVAPDEVVTPTSIPKVRLLGTTSGELGLVLDEIEAGCHDLEALTERLVCRLPALFPDLAFRPEPELEPEPLGSTPRA